MAALGEQDMSCAVDRQVPRDPQDILVADATHALQRADIDVGLTADLADIDASGQGLGLLLQVVPVLDVRRERIVAHAGPVFRAPSGNGVSTPNRHDGALR